MEKLQALLHEAQLRAEVAERRLNEERQKREAFEQRAQASEQRAQASEQRAQAFEQTQPSTLSEYLNACHRLVFAELRVKHNPDRLSRAPLTNPQSKRCPTTLRQWPDLLEQQRRIFGLLLETFPCDSDRLFESEHFLRTMGARIGRRIIAGEKALWFFLHDAVEDPVRIIIDELVKIPAVRKTFDLGHGIVFDSPPHALSEAAEEVIDRMAHTATPSTSGHGENLRKLQADQICIYRSDSIQGEQTRAFICECKPPHKLTIQHLHVGLRVTDIYKEVVNRKTIPTSEDPEALFAYHAERLTASAMTQTYNYMIEGGLEYSLLTTGEAMVFLKIDWTNPETLYYHLAVPSVEVAAQTNDANYCTAVAQYLAFTLLAIDGLGMRSHTQDERDRATKELNKWEVSFDLIYRSIPEEDRCFLSDSSPDYQPPTYGNVDRSPIRPRKQPRRGPGHAEGSIQTWKQDDESESSDEEPNSSSPTTPTREGARRSTRLAMQRRGGSVNNGGQPRDFCTQKCLLGLVRGHALDQSCPNAAIHRHGATTYHDGAALRHPVDHAQWLNLLRAQLETTLDDGITPLKQSGARCVLFKVTLLAYGYTFVSKGTIEAFIPDLEREAAVYRRLDDLQSILVPVFLGAVDLRPLNRTYFLDLRVYIVHLTCLAFGGEDLYERRGAMDITEQQVKDSLRAIHDRGVIHKDVRAPNILFCRETNGVMIIDFERAVLLEPPRRALAKVAPNKRILQDTPGEQTRHQSRWVTRCFSEDMSMAGWIFVNIKT
ncbi:Protein kinase-like domain protein [Metarhizium rileyi]|uniref:Protein kinase-like domain protein n=1 Tax=Metarhizium rileyi (strain RCEF 4871) TaxID=1649241 RepID=A0A166ZWK9_METRR|nr:Protein kinase-like domain protein [Metarhizium rileyi RCEF 4871]